MTKAEKRAAKAAAEAAARAATETVAPEQQPETTVAETQQSTEGAAETSAPAQPEAKAPPVLEMKKGVVYRGAREEWYKRMLSLEGKTKAEVMENLTADRPSVYGQRSKHAGNPEPVPGWVRFFERTGVAVWK